MQTKNYSINRIGSPPATTLLGNGSRPGTSRLLQTIRMVACLYILIVATLVTTANDAEDELPTREYRIKAGFLYNFTGYIDWPANRSTSPASDRWGKDFLIISILGQDRFGKSLDSLDGKQVKDRTIKIRRLKSSDPLGHCHLLFISSSEDARTRDILAAMSGKGVLTIGESDTFADNGGIIEFFLDRNKIRFKINLDLAEQEGFKISSKLLRLARIIKGKPLTDE